MAELRLGLLLGCHPGPPPGSGVVLGGRDDDDGGAGGGTTPNVLAPSGRALVFLDASPPPLSDDGSGHSCGAAGVPPLPPGAAQRHLALAPPGSGPITALAAAPGGAVYAVAEATPGGGGAVHIHDGATRRRVRTLGGLPGGARGLPVAHLAFTADGRHVLVQGGAPGWALALVAWGRPPSGRVEAVLPGVAPPRAVRGVVGVAPHPTDPACVALAGPGVLRLLRVGGDGAFKPVSVGGLARREPGADVTCLAWGGWGGNGSGAGSGGGVGVPATTAALTVGHASGEAWVVEGGEFRGLLDRSPPPPPEARLRVAPVMGGPLSTATPPPTPTPTPTPLGGTQSQGTPSTGGGAPILSLAGFSGGFVAGCAGGVLQVFTRRGGGAGARVGGGGRPAGPPPFACAAVVLLGGAPPQGPPQPGPPPPTAWDVHRLSVTPGEEEVVAVTAGGGVYAVSLAGALRAGAGVVPGHADPGASSAGGRVLTQPCHDAQPPEQQPLPPAAVDGGAAAAPPDAAPPLWLTPWGANGTPPVVTALCGCARRPWFLTAGADCAVRLWGLQGGGGGADDPAAAAAASASPPALLLTAGGFEAPPTAVALHPSGHHALVGGGGGQGARLFNVVLGGLALVKELPLRVRRLFVWASGPGGAGEGRRGLAGGSCSPPSLRAALDAPLVPCQRSPRTPPRCRRTSPPPPSRPAGACSRSRPAPPSQCTAPTRWPSSRRCAGTAAQ